MTEMNTIEWLKITRRRLGCLALVVLGAGLLVTPCDSIISDLRRCHDETCSEVVSLGKTVLKYRSNDPDVLSFDHGRDVKIFSKHAGKRDDLWGVEIGNKRGYAPRQFIREIKVLKKDLIFEVPTEYSLKAEESSENKSEESVTSTEQILTQVLVDSLNKSEETINLQEISPSYESIYDGTVIPQNIEEVAPSQPNYTTQVQKDNIKSEEEVQLNVHPSLLISTFSAISGIFGGSEDSSGDSNDDIASSESSVIDETTEKIAEITNLESHLTSENKPNLSESPLTESKIENVEKQVSEPTIDKNVTSESILQTDKSADENIISEDDTITKSSSQNEGQEVIVDADRVVETSSTESPLSNGNEDPVESTIEIQVVKEISDEHKIIVPKLDEVAPIVDSLNTTETDAVAVSGSTLDNGEIVLNDTVDFFKTEHTVTSTQVPLKQEIKEETVVTVDESPSPIVEPSLQSSFSLNDSTVIESAESVDIESVKDTSEFNKKLQFKIEEIFSEKQLDNNVTNDSNVTDSDHSISQVPINLQNDSIVESMSFGSQSAESSQESIVDIPATSSFNEFLEDRNLFNATEGSEEIRVNETVTEENLQSSVVHDSQENLGAKDQQVGEIIDVTLEEIYNPASSIEKVVLPPETCEKVIGCSSKDTKHQYTPEENAVTSDRMEPESSDTLSYVCVTAVTTLLFSLGYYLIENRRRDAYLIEKINKLEKDLMITRKECIMLDENFKSTKTKLDSIEDESFGSNEMVLSLKAELETSEKEKEDLRDQIVSLEKDLEGASEAGLELERMLREILATQSEDNPLAQSIQDLQDRLNDQQNANVALTNALALKTRENENLSTDLEISVKTIEQLQTDVSKLAEELNEETNSKISLEQSLIDQVQMLEIQVKTLTEDKSNLRKQLKMKELEVKELSSIIEQVNLNNLDIGKLYEVTHVKAEVAHLQEERDELKMKLNEEEGAHQLLEEHVKLVQEEVAALSEQSRAAEREKKEAETRLEVLTKFFEEKEAQRQKEEALWLEKQGEHSSTVERIQTMQNELLNYKQQIEMLKREILDQEREYKNQIAIIETKAHEHWVAARQNERRLEEIKAESSQLRNRLTLVEKNMNDTDPESKLHRLQQQVTANGDASGLPHPMFPGGPGENSTSPLMFAGGPLHPPSYIYSGRPLLPPPFLPPPLPQGSSGAEIGVGSRPAPLGGGRLSSPPPPGRPGSPPRLSPPPPMIHHGFPLHSPPPLPPYANDVPHMLPPMHHPPPHHMMPPPPPPLLHPTHHRHPPPPQQQQHLQDGAGNWSADTLPGTRNSAAFHVQQRPRNHKGSLHSSGESLDKSYGGKV